MLKIVVFRVDASLLIGAGHVMRCLNLAEQLRAKGADVLFICRNHPGNLMFLIKQRGFGCYSLDLAVVETVVNEQSSADDYANWLGTSQEQDAQQTQQIVQAYTVDLLIVDSYSLDQKWEIVLKPYTKKLMVIDDLANRKHHCDILLDQNYYKNKDIRYTGLVESECTLFLGPQYTLLNLQFYAARLTPRIRGNQVKRVLIFFGGADVDNDTSKALRVVLGLNLANVAVDVVTASMNIYNLEIEKLCQQFPQVKYHCQIDYMAKLIQAADLSIGAGGSITWERCCLGLPSIVMSLAENQEEVSRDLAELGAIFYCGSARQVSEGVLTQICHKLINSPVQLKEISDTGLQIFSGVSENFLIDEIYKACLVSESSKLKNLSW